MVSLPFMVVVVEEVMVVVWRWLASLPSFVVVDRQCRYLLGTSKTLKKRKGKTYLQVAVLVAMAVPAKVS